MSPAKPSNKEKEKVVVRRITRSSVLQVSVEKNNNDKDNTGIVKEIDKKTEEVVDTTVIVEDDDGDAEDLLRSVVLNGNGDEIFKSIPVETGSAQKKPGSEPEKTAQVEKGPAREKQIETPSKGGKEAAQKEPETPAQEQHEPRAQESTEEEEEAQQGEPAQEEEEEEDEETQEPESPIVYEEGPKPNKENTIPTPPRESEGPGPTETAQPAQQGNIKKKRGRKRRERGEQGGYGRYIYKVLKQVHPELGVSSKAMTVLDNYMRDMFERLAVEAARLGDYSKKRTLTSREVQGAVRLVLPGELGKHAIAEGSKAVSNFMAFDD